jgi:urease subunit gamma/beta
MPRVGAAWRDTERMLLTPAERDRLLLFTAAQLARSRRARGLRLNVPETIAVVADTVCEAARDGARHADALAAGLAALGPDDVLPGVPAVVHEVKVEAVFDDGTRLVVVPHPVGPPPPSSPVGDHALRERADQRDRGDHAPPGPGGPGGAPIREREGGVHELHDHGQEVAVDPVCGMTVVPGPDVPHLEVHGVTYWFCAPGCRAAYAARTVDAEA